MRGLRLTRSAVEGIHESSGGWVSAIYLLGEGLRAGGEIGRGKGIDALFEENLLRSPCRRSTGTCCTASRPLTASRSPWR
jgi:hypothetical protein